MTAVSVMSTRRLSKQVDELGALNAQISVLQRKADAIKATLKDSGYDEIFGQSYRAVISTRETARLNAERARGYLTPRQIDHCTDISMSQAISLYDL